MKYTTKKRRSRFAFKTLRNLFFIVIILLALPLTVIITLQQQKTQQHAATASTYPASDGNILWTGDWETGDTSQWSLHTGGHWGNSNVQVVTSPVYQGKYAGKLTLN